MALSPEQELELLLLVEAEGEQPSQAPAATPQPEQPSAMQQLGQTAMTAGPMAALGQGVQMAFEKGGENLAQNLAAGVSVKPGMLQSLLPGNPAALAGLVKSTPGQGLRVKPEIAAGIGTAVQMTPDIVSSFAPAGEVAKIAEKGAGVVGRMATAGGKLANLEERLLLQQEALGTLPERVAKRGAELAAEKTAVGKAIGQVEELGGYGMKQMPDEFQQILDNPKELSEMGLRLRQIADTPINKLTDALSTNQLQRVRKFAQFVRERGSQISRDIKANVAMGGHQAGQALRKVDDAFDAVISRWENVDNKIRALKGSKEMQKAAINAAIRQTRQAIKETKRFLAIRKGLVYTGAGAAGLGYFGSILRAVTGG